MSTIPRELELLKQLIGDWKIDMDMRMPDGSMAKGAGRATGRVVSGGSGLYGVLVELEAEIEGMGRLDELDLFGFNAHDGKVHSFTLNSMGTSHDHIGGWKSDRILEIGWSGVADGKDSSELITFTWNSPKELAVNEVDRVEGAVSMLIRYTLRKQ